MRRSNNENQIIKSTSYRHIYFIQSIHILLILLAAIMITVQKDYYSTTTITERGRQIKTLEQHVLQNSNLTADEFYRRAIRKNTDMAGNRRNRSMSTTVDGS